MSDNPVLWRWVGRGRVAHAMRATDITARPDMATSLCGLSRWRWLWLELPGLPLCRHCTRILNRGETT